MKFSTASCTATPDGDVRQRLHLDWLIKLRWGAVIGQFLSVVVAFCIFGLALPIGAMLAVVVLTAVSNFALRFRGSRAEPVSEAWVGSVVTLDVILLTVLLYCSGGSTNPFCFLYLIHMALAAVILSSRWVVGLVVFSSACFVWLTYFHVPTPMSQGLHQRGLVVAYLLAAVFIVYFVQRVHCALRTKQELLAAAAARSERLTSLATLAAGAAHELSTPLATIAVVAKELEHRLARSASGAASPDAAAAIEDAQLIRQEVERCRTVLSHMAADAGTHSGEPFVEITVAELLDAALTGLAQRERVQLHDDSGALSQAVRVPQRSVAQAVRGITKNAFDASQQRDGVHLRVHCDAGRLHLAVEDQGHGMSSEILARAGEPFFTTKAPGRGPSGGMGLGLFLARTLFEHIGGSLHVTSEPHKGTRVVMILPMDAAS